MKGHPPQKRKRALSKARDKGKKSTKVDPPKTKKGAKEQLVQVPIAVPRCTWVNENNALYAAYHDEEWGVPIYDSTALFELLCLEGQVAGLSWLTVLVKREAYRSAFHHFNPRDVAKVSAKDLEKMMAAGKTTTPAETVVRHRGKLDAVVTNAKALLAMEKNEEPFDQFVWSFVATPQQMRKSKLVQKGKGKASHPRLLSVPVKDVRPLTSNWKEVSQVPTRSAEADNMSSALKARGFAFVGPVTCHSFMQAAGLRNDHIIRCAFRRM